MKPSPTVTEKEKSLLAKASQIMRRIRMETTTPQQRKAASEKARLAGLAVRRANAARRKAEKEAGS